MRRRSIRFAKRSGVQLVEAALVMSICLLFIIGILEYGRLMMTKQILDNAAREGARYAVVNTNNATTADVQNVVDTCMAGQGAQLSGYSKSSNISVFMADPTTGTNIGTWTNARFGQAIGVQITGTYQPVLPIFVFLPGNITLTGQCLMRSEGN
jgi:Flp pilus assembly protein TadG